MEQTIITRVKFCNQCFKEGRPKSNESYVIYGGHSKTYQYRKSFYFGVRGFSPHIYLLSKVIGEVVKYYYSCSICNTLQIQTGKKGVRFIIPDDTFKEETMNIKDWNALVLHPDFGYKI